MDLALRDGCYLINKPAKSKNVSGSGFYETGITAVSQLVPIPSLFPASCIPPGQHRVFREDTRIADTARTSREYRYREQYHLCI